VRVLHDTPHVGREPEKAKQQAAVSELARLSKVRKKEIVETL